MLILVLGMVYFLWTSLKQKSAGKLKNPNELFSYLALGTISQIIFLIKLCCYSAHIKHDWLDADDNKTPDDPSNLKNLTIGLFSLTLICILGVIIIIFFMAVTAKPLRDYILSDIFYEIGANLNAIQTYKAKTAFFGTNKVDLVMHLLYINTLAFLAYDLKLQNNLNETPYWVLLGLFGALALFNNVHGNYIM